MITWMQRHKKWLIITIWISTIAFIGAGFVGWGSYNYGSSAGSSAATWRSSGLSNIGDPTPVSIVFNGGMINDVLQMSVTVSSESDLSTTDLRLFVCTSIDSVYYNIVVFSSWYLECIYLY